jgi:chitin disaccharide deacetylase
MQFHPARWTRCEVTRPGFLSREGRTRLLRPFALPLCILLSSGSPTHLVAEADAATRVPATEQIYLLIRSDDAGMSHSVNVALERLIQSGLPVSVSVMFPTPWHQETVEMLKRHSDVSVGIHLTLNSEWRNYRWGPVLGRSAVPTLVDSNGYFFQSTAALHRNRPDLREVERELRAQIERAVRSGLKIDYVDYHMGTPVSSPEFREVTERLAREFGLGMSGYFGEARHDPQYRAAPPHKIDSLVALVERLQPGVNVVITHVGVDDAELGALLDMNSDGGLAEMSKNRQGELDALTSPRFKQALEARSVRLLTYRQLIEMQGLKSMRRPEG